MREINKLDDLLNFVNKNKISRMYLEVDENDIGSEDVVLGRVANGVFRLMSKQRCDKKGSNLNASDEVPDELELLNINYAIYYYGITAGKGKKFYLG